jgi:hypothetical protein
MDGLSVSELQGEAQQAFERFNGSQQDLADILTVHRSAISRAVRHEGMKHAAVQSRIISYVKAVPVQRRSTYQGRHVRHEWIVGP